VTDVTTLQYGAMLTGLGGGLALFLYGLRKLTEGLKTLAGHRMKYVLARMTTNRFTGLLAGAAVTAVIQSSSVTTVLVVGFISVGLMSFTQSIGVIMGANIGTTITAQIVAFKVTQYALVMIATGFIVEVAARSERLRQGGIALMGLGLLFFGMDLMSGAMDPLRTWPPFIEFMKTIENPIFGVLVGFIFTALIQSSSATTGVVIVLAAGGLVTLETGIAIAFGANIGTCVTASLSVIGRPREAVRAATVHIIFNLLGVLLWIFFIPQFADLVRFISPTSPALSGAARAAAETPRQIANAHTLFNFLNAVIFIWFTHPIERLVLWIVPSKRIYVSTGSPRFLESMYLSQPTLALDRVKLETQRLGRRVYRMVSGSFDVVVKGNIDDISRMRARDDDVDSLHRAIITYLDKITHEDMVDPLPARVQTAFGVVNYLENIGDVVETDLMASAEQRRSRDIILDKSIEDSIRALHATACGVLENSLTAFVEGDKTLAEEARERKADFNAQANSARVYAGQSLASDSVERLEAYRVAVDTIECYSRIHSLARRVARLVVLEPQGRVLDGTIDAARAD
jgi:phosphate:Na+ symporter